MSDRLRRCTVGGRAGWFHRWVEAERVVEPSPMIGGHGGGVVKNTYGIVEFEDGRVAQYSPNSFRFTDKPENDQNTEAMPQKEDGVLQRIASNLWARNFCPNLRSRLDGCDKRKNCIPCIMDWLTAPSNGKEWQ